MTQFTHTEEEVRARHEARWAKLLEHFGDKFAVPREYLARLHELNRLDWTVWVAERDGKKVETIVPVDISISVNNRPGITPSEGDIESTIEKSPESPGVDAKEKNFAPSLEAAYAALVGTPPGLDGRVQARRALVGMPLL